MQSVEQVRLDKFLWAVRLYKTRAQATEACRGGHVTVGGQAVKPSREVRVGDVIGARAGGIQRTVKVLALADRRVGPKLVDTLVEDQTPASEYLKLMTAREAPVAKREKGAGRPTKKDRRQIERLLE